MSKLFSRKPKAEAQVFFEETYPLPVVTIAMIGLFATNVAVTLSALAALS
jgi:hypothetical protein